jgi:hypothetical protein
MKNHYSEGIYILKRKKDTQKDVLKIKLTKSEAKVLFTLYAHLGFDEITLDEYPYNA